MPCSQYWSYVTDLQIRGTSSRSHLPGAPSISSSIVKYKCMYRRYSFRFESGPESVGMATGATIHTANGLKARLIRRNKQEAAVRSEPILAGASAG